MLRSIFLISCICSLSLYCTHKAMESNTPTNSPELGMEYTPEASTIRIWAPSAQAAQILLYASGAQEEPEEQYDLKKGTNGYWEARIPGNQKGRFYTIQTKHKGQWLEETADLYARAVGVNGKKGQIIDLATTNPPGWDTDQRPGLKSPNDIILYELQLRDFTKHQSAGNPYGGQYLGLAESGTRNPAGQASGLDHLRVLGITHVHIMPAFDFRSIDESLPADERPYNWGYDPQHYNVPEGSFASDPYDGALRIKEFKTMVQALHKAGIRVVLDVVYNHTGGPNEESVFNLIEPDYFYRLNSNGSYSNASACGNETASEKNMMRRFMVESVLYWAKEYHIDGFRFDLMGIHDIQTMNAISAALHREDPSIFIYGEGWKAGDSPLPDSLLALKANVSKLQSIAAFSDEMRDGLKGHVFSPDKKGFVSGEPGLEESVRFGIVAATQHPQLDYKKVNYSDAPWAPKPSQCINYASCHDNHCLWDRLEISCPGTSTEDRQRMHKLALATVLSSQGIPFLHAGTEFMRTKQGVENSFESPDAINLIDWNRKGRYLEVYEYTKGLIELRKNHPAFRMPTSELIQKHLEFLPSEGHANFIPYILKDYANDDKWESILVLLNGSDQAIDYALPEGIWTVVVDQYRVNERGIHSMKGSTVQVPKFSAMILFNDLH